MPNERDVVKVKAKLTRAEYERLMWWLHRPVPPGTMKALDVSLIQKLGGR